jgi:hypothetical protein
MYTVAEVVGHQKGDLGLSMTSRCAGRGTMKAKDAIRRVGVLVHRGVGLAVQFGDGACGGVHAGNLSVQRLRRAPVARIA